MPRIIILHVIILLWGLSFQAMAMEPLSEAELYDTSGQASPTTTIQYSDDLTVDYFNQNVVIYLPDETEQVITLNKVSYGQEHHGKMSYLTLIWPEPLEVVIEYDKYPNFPNGIMVNVSDIMQTGPDGKPLPQYDDPFAPAALPANTVYLRTKSGPVTITTRNNLQYISLVGEAENGGPNWAAASKDENILLSWYQGGTQRVELLGYVYIWAHK